MHDIRFDPPKSVVADIAVDNGRRVPDDVLRHIRQAWIAGVVSAGLTLLFMFLATAGTRVGRYGSLPLVDVVLILLLAFGTSRKSRLCAVLMFVYFLASKILAIKHGGSLNGALYGLAFLYFFGQGAMATFDYHRIRKG